MKILSALSGVAYQEVGGILTALAAPNPAPKPGMHSTILFKGKQPIKIGLGEQVGSTIKWTDCSGKNSESFVAPLYALDSVDNCSVGPAAFGLECDGESCKVIDAETLGDYLSGVRSGQRIQLRIREHSVEIQSESTTVRLER